MKYNFSPHKVTLFFLLALSVAFVSSCEKYLDKKPLKSLVVPSSLNDLQVLLDNHNSVNERSPELLELVADNYYVTTDDWQSSDENERMNYIWDKDATLPISWQTPYQDPIYYANVVLDALPRINFNEGDIDIYNSIKGAALFYRAFAFHQLAQLYCQPYSTANSGDLGIVLRLTAVVEDRSTRSTIQQTYDQIISDLKMAANLLPETVLFSTRPNKAAAYGALARTYLSMRDYVNAGYYADLSLQDYSLLVNYNSLVPVASPPVSRFNAETVFYNHCGAFLGIIYPPYAKVDTILYASYSADDLRKEVFFYENPDGSFSFRGSYDGDYWESSIFDGITTSEMYLIRAESFARAGDATSAMMDLNNLLETRWRSGSFVPFTASSAEDALAKILTERRKELVFRGLRWTDLRRLNLEGANITLTRVIDGNTYILEPGDLRWVMLIPQEVINYSGIAQNPR